MSPDEFTTQLHQLPPSDWQALQHGQALLLVDDSYLQPGPSHAHNVIIPSAADLTASPTELQRQHLAKAQELLTDYYRTHPLTRKGFTQQVKELIELHGAAAFAALPGELPDYSLFVDVGTVIAESRQSPRHRYGAYCELPRRMPEAALQNQVQAWLDSGEAYERYLSMNVCRYNC